MQQREYLAYQTLQQIAVSRILSGQDRETARLEAETIARELLTRARRLAKPYGAAASQVEALAYQTLQQIVVSAVLQNKDATAALVEAETTARGLLETAATIAASLSDGAAP